MSRRTDAERCFEKLVAGTVVDVIVHEDGTAVIYVDCPDGIRRDVYFYATRGRCGHILGGILTQHRDTVS